MAALIELWNSMKPAARIRAVIMASLIIVAAIAAAVWALSERYETLFSSMESQDAAAVVAELERMGVVYKLAEGGTRISVSADQVHETRLKLIGSGVPLRGGVGFEIFDESGFGMTEFTQKINYQRALEGELSRTISSLKEVKYARVHLVLSESSLFQKQQASPSASVTLFLKQGASLDEARIVGLQKLVSAAVPGLEAKGVTVTDQNGVTLSRGKEQDDEYQAITSRLQKKRELEAYFSGKVTEVLEKALGPGRAVVSVDVSLNMDQVRTTREEVIPHGDPQSEVLRRRESKSSGGSASGQGGNVVTEVEYLLGRKVEQIAATPGAIERLSIGVLVPGNVAGERVEEIRSLVAMAVGLNATRGDAIAVFAGNFRAPAAAEPAANAPMESAQESQAAVQPEREIAPAVERAPLAWDPQDWLRYPQAILGLVMVAVAVLVLLAMAVRRGPRRLRPEERVALLKRLETWSRAESDTAIEKGLL